MLRMLTIVAAIVGAALFSSVALAQSPEPTLPVAGPDEIIFVGEAPAPPGTEITAIYVPLEDGDNGVVTCGTTRLDETSRFTLVINAVCADGAVGPLICWGSLGTDSCQGFSKEPLSVVPREGQTIDVGLLAPTEREPDIVAPPHGDGGPNVVLPLAGSDGGAESGFPSGAPLWFGVALLAAGLVAGAAGTILARQ